MSKINGPNELELNINYNGCKLKKRVGAFFRKYLLNLETDSLFVQHIYRNWTF